MRPIFRAILILLTLAVPAFAGTVTSAAPASTNKILSFGSNGATRKDLLTDEQVAALKSEIPGRKENMKVVFQSTFSQPRLSPAELRRLKDGQIPFRITVELNEIAQANGRIESKRLPGYVRLYVLDSAGQLVVSKREPLERMCPT